MEEAIPATSPNGSSARALLLGSTARLIDIISVTEIKNKAIFDGSPKVTVDTAKQAATKVYSRSKNFIARLAPYFVDKYELIKVDKAMSRPMPPKIHANNEGLP